MALSHSARTLFSAIALALALSAVGAADARACSCIQRGDLRNTLAAGAPAMVGVVVGKRSVEVTPPPEAGSSSPLETRYEYTVRVDRAANAPLGDQLVLVGGNNGALCGFEWDVGQRVGAFLYRDSPGVWSTGSCGLADTAALERAMRQVPQPVPAGPLTLLAGGQFGGTDRLLELNAQGEIVRYGTGGGTVRRLSVCPGSQQAVELVDRDGETRLEVRDLRSLSVLRSVSLGRVASASETAVEVVCASPRGELIYAAVVDRRAKRVRLFEVDGEVARELAAPQGSVVALSPSAAYVGGRTRISFVDLESGRTRRIARAHGTRLLAVSPVEERLAILDRDGLRVRSLTGSRTRSARVRRADTLAWLGTGRLLVGGGGGARLYSARLKLLRRYPGYVARGHARVGGRVFGVDDRRLVALELGSIGVRFLSPFSGSGAIDLVAVPGTPALAARSSTTRPCTAPAR